MEATEHASLKILKFWLREKYNDVPMCFLKIGKEKAKEKVRDEVKEKANLLIPSHRRFYVRRVREVSHPLHTYLA